MPLAELQKMQHNMPEQFSLIVGSLAVQECESLKIEGIYVSEAEMRRVIVEELRRLTNRK